jgi:hypothetical protein
VIFLNFKEKLELIVDERQGPLFPPFGFDRQISVQLTKVFTPKVLIAKKEPLSPAAKFRIITTLQPSGKKSNSFSRS